MSKEIMGTSSQKLTAAVVAYSLCSSSLLLLNKIVLTYFPYPSYVTSFQFGFAVTAITLLKTFGLIQVRPINNEVLETYGVYVLMFMGGIYANMRALETSNVETVIVARACTPLLVSLLEYQFLGRTIPSSKSLMSLMTIVAGAMFYVTNDGSFAEKGAASYTWPLIYLLIISVEMTFGKHVKSKLETSLFESVFYTNSLSCVPMLMWAMMMGEHSKPMPADGSKFVGAIILFAASTVGVGIGYSSWNARGLLSATSFTLVGVVNKFLTIFVNLFIWDKHADLRGILGLVVCLAGATFYRQAPLRKESQPNMSEYQNIIVTSENSTHSK